MFVKVPYQSDQNPDDTNFTVRLDAVGSAPGQISVQWPDDLVNRYLDGADDIMTDLDVRDKFHHVVRLSSLITVALLLNQSSHTEALARFDSLVQAWQSERICTATMAVEYYARDIAKDDGLRITERKDTVQVRSKASAPRQYAIGHSSAERTLSIIAATFDLIFNGSPVFLIDFFTEVWDIGMEEPDDTVVKISSLLKRHTFAGVDKSSIVN
jgi:hypothetical protein